MVDSGFYLFFDVGHNGVTAILCVLCTYLGSNGEARGYGHSEQIHLSEIGAFTAEQVAHRSVALGFAVAKRINFLCHKYIELYAKFQFTIRIPKYHNASMQFLTYSVFKIIRTHIGSNTML